MTNPTIEAMRAKHAKEIADMERHLAVREAVTLALGLTDENWSPGAMHAHRADCFILMNAPDLSAALELAEKMNPIAMVKKTKGGTAFIPLCRMKDSENDDSELVAPWRYDIRGLRHHKEDKVLLFYVEAGAHVVEVRVNVESDPLTFRRYVPAQRDSRGRITREAQTDCANGSGHFCSVIRWWCPPGELNNFTLYSR